MLTPPNPEDINMSSLRAFVPQVPGETIAVVEDAVRNGHPYITIALHPQDGGRLRYVMGGAQNNYRVSEAMVYAVLRELQQHR